MYTFKANSSKSNAKRFLVNTCKKDVAEVEAYLTEVDGKWGSYLNQAGQPVHFATATVVASIETKVETIVERLDSALGEVLEDLIGAVGANVFASMVTPAAPPAIAATTIVRDGKKVDPNAEVVQHEEEQRERGTKNFIEGYRIEKDRPEQNGVKRPSQGTLCGAVWAKLDSIRESGRMPVAKELGELAIKNKWNPTNVVCEFYQWRRFNGIRGRQVK